MRDFRTASADAHQSRFRPIGCHLFKGIANDRRRIVPDAELQKDDLFQLYAFQKLLVSCSLVIPLLILHKVHIFSYVDLHAFAAARTARHKLCWNTAVLLAFTHLHDELTIVIQLVMTAAGTLQLAVISLHHPKAHGIKTGFGKLCVYIGRDHKTGLIPDKLQKLLIHPANRRVVAVHADMP